MAYGQTPIIYDLDSYKRVDIDYRTTTFSPDLLIEYDKTLNTPGQEKFYGVNIGGYYRDRHLINDEKNQKSYYCRVALNANAGSLTRFNLNYDYEYINRSYSDLAYFKTGFDISSNTNYGRDFNQFKDFKQDLRLSYDIGFGFGRLEIVNNAWLGARILEELSKNEQLTMVPEADGMKELFDVIGDLEFERVMDGRLMTMNRLEKMIEYMEQNEFIDDGSIPAFVTIYDAFRYESFFIRQSGERLEFTLNPIVQGNYVWNELSGLGVLGFNSSVQPGFEGSIEYESHKNGDLEYYSIKSIGGTIGYFERFQEGGGDTETIIAGDLNFNYTYRYLPSLRTNLEFSTSVTGSVVKLDDYSSILNVMSRLSYFYYFSPATQLVLGVNFQYTDNEFQIKEYQPSIRTRFSIDVVHAIR